ncbi:MAG: VWA domain-containing protein [Archangium sp.]|nr:VWA domain-containing protein [Archangium sp.]
MTTRALVLSMPWVLVACSDVFIEPKTKQSTNVDDRLALTGRVCTAPPDPSGFPVKVVLIVDQSGSMCVSDPPGSQESSGFCEMYASVPPGITQPARVRALNRLIDQFQSQPNVQVSLVPFETNVKGPWPAPMGATRFARPDATLRQRVQGLQAELGKGTDYQGALAYAYGVIAGDIANVSVTNPEQLPRTRYVVVFLTDGVPFPRCAANDNLTLYADDLNPELIWADAQGTGDFCNQIDPDDPDAITGCPGGGTNCANPSAPFIAGTDRNQNYQLFNYVEQLMELKSQYNIGDVRMHSVLLFNEEAVRACGPICQDLYGRYVRYPGPTPVADGPAAAKRIAGWLLKEFAQRGNGVYQEFNDFQGIAQINLGALDYSSLASRNVMKSLIVQALSSEPGEVNRLIDSDGDGLPDDVDNDFSYKTNRFIGDTDGDGFLDKFEVDHFENGFLPDQKDGRGCDPMSPLTPGCVVRDTDGDGLSQYAEQYLDKLKLFDNNLVDADGDGIPNGLEVRYGLDPLKAQGAGLDTDGDGVPDLEEFRVGSNPVRRDHAYSEKNAYQYELTSETQGDGRICYDFTVSNLQLVTPPTRAGLRQGFNLFKLWFGEAPESGAATDYGTWRTACAWAQYDPPSVRVPAGPQVGPFANTNFVAPAQMVDSTQYESRCIGVSPTRGQATP